MPLQNVLSQKFWRVSKYIFPCNKLAWNLRGAPAPTRLASLNDLLVLYPNLVTQTEVGYDRDWGQVTFPTLQAGHFKPFVAEAEPQYRLRVFSFRESTTVGRHCAIMGPENTLVADLGYFVPHTDPKDLHWAQHFNPRFWRSRWLVDLRYRHQLPAIQKLPGTVALLNNPWCHNYYHWILEVAPRVMLMRQAGLEADWYVVDCQSAYQKRALELMGIPRERCIQPHYGLHLQADQLLRPSYPGAVNCQMMAEAISQNVQASTSGPTGNRVYITRKTAAHRKLVNESELEQYLQAYGFQSYSFDRLDFAEQVRIMRSAECVVTVHGAALANLIFARPGTRVIEICPIGRYNADCFPRLSHKLGHHHLSIMAPSTRFRQNLSVSLQDVGLALEYHGLGQTEGRSTHGAKAA